MNSTGESTGRGKRRLQFSIRALLIVVALCAGLAAWCRTVVLQPTWTTTRVGNVIYAVRKAPWPSTRKSLDYVLFLPHLRGPWTTGGSLRQYHVRVGDSYFEGRIEESHTIWVAADGTFVPYPGQVSLKSLLAYLAKNPADSWSAAGLTEFVRMNQTDGT